MAPSRILFGLDRLPATLDTDDNRLPGIVPGPAPLRLNTEPLPAEASGDGATDHAARVVLVRAWLLAGCGDYDVASRRAVTRYLDAIATHIARHRDRLAADLARFHGIYRPEDWFWSALRPLPRAWWRDDGGWRHAELAFWTGQDVLAMAPGDFAGDEPPPPFQYFWNGDFPPTSPFRRQTKFANDLLTVGGGSVPSR